MHEHFDEVTYITSGEGTGIVGEKCAPLAAGTVIYIAKGVWHGIESDGKEMELPWIVSPPGLDAMWRELAAPIGQPQKVVTQEERIEVMKKHGMRFKPD